MEKVVFFIGKLYGGGAERVTAALANKFCEKDYEVHIIVYSRNLESEYYVNNKIIIHSHDDECIPKNRIKAIISRIKFLIKTIKEIAPMCVISLGGPKETTLLTSAAKINKKVLILSERNDPQSYPQGKMLRFLRTLNYLISSGVVFQTNGAKSFFSKKIQDKSVVICNPLSDNVPERFVGEREKIIVNWCRLDSQKNLDMLINAFSKIVKKYPEYRLHIYGEGPEKERLELKVKSMSLDTKVFFKGYSNNIYELVRNAALFVSTSNYEGISNSMLEAIAMGIPSICTDCPAGGAKETIENGVNGILVPVGDENKLTEAIEMVLSDKTFFQKISDEGCKLRVKLDIDVISEQWIDFISNTIIKNNI